MNLLGRFFGLRNETETRARLSTPSTPRAVARELADIVSETASDDTTLGTLLSIARLWRTREEGLADELVYLDAYAVEFSLDRVTMPESMRVRLREEFRDRLETLGVDMDACLDRRREYMQRIEADRLRAMRGSVMHGIASSIGHVFNLKLSSENPLLADTVGRRFLDRTEVLRSHLGDCVKAFTSGK